MMKNRNIKTYLSDGAHLCCGFVSVLSVLFGVISVIAQETEPANWIDSRYNRPGVHIVTNAPSPAEMAMQSNNVTVATDAKLALKIDETRWYFHKPKSLFGNCRKQVVFLYRVHRRRCLTVKSLGIPIG